VAVVINRMESRVEPEPTPVPQAAPAEASPEADLEDFRRRYCTLVREMIRDEIERYLRSAAD